MPETTPPTPTPPPAPRRSSAGRTVALVVAGLVGLLAAGLFAAGGVGLWADGQKDADGYLSTGSHRLAASSYAIASDDLDVDLDGAGTVLHRDRYGDVRLAATGRNGKDVFVGIARTRDVAAYLRRSAHATVTDVSTSPFHAHLPGPRRRPAAGRADVRALLGRLRPWRRDAGGHVGGPGRPLVGRGHERRRHARRRRRGQRRREPPVPARRGLGLDRRRRGPAPRRGRPAGRRPAARAPAPGRAPPRR